jgi:phospholipid/cholesterol/gamma-HCH transport system substrate-binding protein
MSRPLVRVAAIGCLICVAILAIWTIFGGDDNYRYSMVFQNGSQLSNGNEMMIGGVPHGAVDSIERTDDNLAKVNFHLDQQLHEGTTAVIRVTSQVGIANRTIALSPGPNDAPVLEEGETLGLDVTQTPVDIDQVFNALNKRTQQGLRDFINGNAQVYQGKGEQANASYKYFAPALSRTDAALKELNSDSALFRKFIVNSSQLATTVAERSDELASAIANSRTTFNAVAQHSNSLDQAVHNLPGLFNQGNTTFARLRDTLDDVDPLVNDAKPATRGLGPFAEDLRPVFKRAVPVFRNLSVTVRKKGPANDSRELLASLPTVKQKSSAAFPAAVRAIDDFLPTLSVARAYTPELTSTVTKLGQVTAYYDANGHYARVSPAAPNFEYDAGNLVPIDLADTFDAYGPPPTSGAIRCPGGATQSAPDGSNPFVNDPPAHQWPQSFLTPADCDVDAVPPGP